MLISVALDRFISEFCYDKGFTKSTVDNYKFAVSGLIKCVGDIEIGIITLEHIRCYRHDMEDHNRDKNGINAYMYKIRYFFKWANKQKLISLNPDDILIPKKRKTLPNYLLPEEIQLLLGVADCRERAIISLLYSTAMRIGELCQVRIKDVRDGTIKIRGKGDMERIVQVDETAQYYVNRYLQTRTDGNPFLFYGNKHQGLTKSTMQRLIRGVGIRAKIGRPVTPHIFRHSTATDLLKGGCNLRYIQEYLGHADISTTQIYTHVASQDLTDAFAKSHKKLVIIA